MTKTVVINGNEHELHYSWENGRAVCGYFNGNDETLVDDLLAEYSIDVRLKDIIQKMLDDIKLKTYRVTVNLTTSRDYVYEVEAYDELEAKNKACCMDDYLDDCVSSHEVNSDMYVVDCEEVADDEEE
jgi:hypothetical protein